MSNNNLEQLATAQKANAEVMMALVRSAFSGMEKLAALNLAATRDIFNASVASAQQLSNLKDPQELVKANASLAQPNVQKMMEYSRNVYDLVAGMQKEITSVMEAQYSSFNRNASTAIEKSTANAPVGGDVFAAAMKQMLQASNKTYDSMTMMAKQMAEIAEANIKATTSAATKVTAPAASATTSSATAAAAAAKKK